MTGNNSTKVRRNWHSLILASSLVVLLGAASGGHKSGSGGDDSHAATKAAHWGYRGADGPARWGQLSSDYRLCKSGHEQSPIDIAASVPEQGIAPLRFDYAPAFLDLVNNGHTVQENYRPVERDTGDSVEIGGRSYPIRASVGAESFLLADDERYELLQFHFHTPSEHRVDGRVFPMEVHLVHRSESGELAVVGVLLEEGESNEFLDGFWRNLPREAEDHVTQAELELDVRDLLPSERSFYHYDGSLTTPPCSEGVNWYVLQQPVRASAAQIRKLERIMGENARPVQARAGRQIVQGP